MYADTMILRRQGLALTLAAASLLVACAAPPPADLATVNRDHQLRALGFMRTEAGWELSLNGKLLFESDSDTLDPDSQATADRLGRSLAQLELRTIRIEGHTDSVGSAAYNQALSMRRAQAVARAMVLAGLRSQIDIVGLGKAAPVTDNRTPEQRLQNRRVAIIVPAQ